MYKFSPTQPEIPKFSIPKAWEPPPVKLQSDFLKPSIPKPNFGIHSFSGLTFQVVTPTKAFELQATIAPIKYPTSPMHSSVEFSSKSPGFNFVAKEMAISFERPPVFLDFHRKEMDKLFAEEFLSNPPLYPKVMYCPQEIRMMQHVNLYQSNMLRTVESSQKLYQQTLKDFSSKARSISFKDLTVSSSDKGYTSFIRPLPTLEELNIFKIRDGSIVQKCIDSSPKITVGILENMLKCCTMVGAEQFDITFAEKREMVASVNHTAAAVGITHGSVEFVLKLGQSAVRATSSMGSEILGFDWSERSSIEQSLIKRQYQKLETVAAFYQKTFAVLPEDKTYQYFKKGTQLLLEYGPMINLPKTLGTGVIVLTKNTLPSLKSMAILSDSMRSCYRQMQWQSRLKELSLVKTKLESIASAAKLAHYMDPLIKAVSFTNLVGVGTSRSYDHALVAGVKNLKDRFVEPILASSDPVYFDEGYNPIVISKSRRIDPYQAEFSSLKGPFIAGINGIGNPLTEGNGNYKYLSSFSGPSMKTGWIFNKSNTVVVDVLETALNFSGISPNTASSIKELFLKFHVDNLSDPSRKLLFFAHSAGNIHTLNALKDLPKEVRDRVIVVQVAPAVLIPKSLCFEVIPLINKTDVVPYLKTVYDLLRACGKPTPEAVSAIFKNLKAVLNAPKLPAHPDSKGTGHSFCDPVYYDEMRKIIGEYEACEGRY